MIPKRPASELIGGGYRFSKMIMLQQYDSAITGAGFPRPLGYLTFRALSWYISRGSEK
jgi:hypothetical protein